ncbi:Cell wall assembly regulator [Scheffersomyces spartinae]|uniref:Cell wall assembly regulator n=1 Tax=Scheffersomyces spartinae TaxID=45513 RepID=A0A9P7VDJ4_9ASCO|nr:Cell wall assembly regulator [Scheffersomyces spartinae]KAG7195339.1 Cell wall assembly regulator [Scheffersomyces spartinae]
MGIFDNLKSFVHSITTDDHYASYDSPYRNSVIQNGSNIGGLARNLSSRLSELNRLATLNSSSHSLVDGASVGYRPGLRSSAVNSTSDLPLQNFNSEGQPPLPSIESLWDTLEKWLEEEYPELEDALNDGVTTADLNEFENDIGCGDLPVEFRQFYKRHDGQFSNGKPTGLIMGLLLLDLESIVQEHSIWGKVNEKLAKQQYLSQQKLASSHSNSPVINPDVTPTSSASSAAAAGLPQSFVEHQRSIPPNAIQPVYCHNGWVPIIKDNCGNQIALDLVPGTAGTWGQVILFGRDFDTKLVIARSFHEFVFLFVSDLQNGNFKIDSKAELHDYAYGEIIRDDDDYMIGDDEEDLGELQFLDRDNEFTEKLQDKVSYVEIWKKRALKKYGVAENYSTIYSPPPPSRKQVNKPTKGSGLSTPVRTGSPSFNISSNKAETVAPVSIPKETVIDDLANVVLEDSPSKEVPQIVKTAPKEEPKKESKVEPKEESKIESKIESKEEPKTESKTESKEETKEEPKTESKTESKNEEEKTKSNDEPNNESKDESNDEPKDEPKKNMKDDEDSEETSEPKPESV